MIDIDAGTLADQAVMIGLLTREQVREAFDGAEDGSLEAVTRSMLRKQMLTSWQLDRLKKGDLDGFFLGGCKVLFHLAEGTFARVYRGIRVQTQEPVAVKVLRQRFTSDPEAVVRFNKEAEAGLKLNQTNIVRIYEFGEQDRRHFIIMEYVEGSNLRDFLKIRKRLEAEAALPLMIGLSQGLRYSLSQGVTHRDIKATNILVSSQGVAKLVDFGLATIEGDEKKMAVAHGQRTVDYSALERTCNSPKGDPRSDIFFLGCVFYQMITGQIPLPEQESKDPLAKMLKRSFGAIKPLSEQRHAPPEALARIVERMMKVDLKARYQNMDDVLRDLEAYEARQAAPAVRPHLAPDPVPAPAQRTADRPASDDSIFGDLFQQPAEPPEPRKILCVEAQEEIQEAFRKSFTKMGYRVTTVSDPARAAEQFREAPPDAVVYDADGLGPQALDALLSMHRRAHTEGRDLAALVLLGPNQGALSDLLPTDDRLIVLSKPIKLKEVREAVAQLVPIT